MSREDAFKCIQNKKSEYMHFGNGKKTIYVSCEKLAKYPNSYPLNALIDMLVMIDVEYENGVFLLKCEDLHLVELAYFYRHDKWDLAFEDMAEDLIYFIRQMKLPFNCSDK